MREALEPALAALPHGVWETWTSCSFRRISRRGGGDGDVLCGTVQRSDGHPDLSWTEKQCEAICTVVNTLRAALTPEGETKVDVSSAGPLGPEFEAVYNANVKEFYEP